MVAMGARVDGSIRVTVAAGPFATQTDPNAVSTSRGLLIWRVATSVPIGLAPLSPGLAAALPRGEMPDAFVNGTDEASEGARPGEQAAISATANMATHVRIQRRSPRRTACWQRPTALDIGMPRQDRRWNERARRS